VSLNKRKKVKRKKEIGQHDHCERRGGREEEGRQRRRRRRIEDRG